MNMKYVLGYLKFLLGLLVLIIFTVVFFIAPIQIGVFGTWYLIGGVAFVFLVSIPLTAYLAYIFADALDF